MTFDASNVDPEELSGPVKELIERQKALADVPAPEAKETEARKEFDVELGDVPEVSEPSLEPGEAPQVQAPEAPAREERETPEPLRVQVPDQPEREEREKPEIPTISEPEPPETEDPEQTALFEQFAAMLRPVVQQINEGFAALAQTPAEPQAQTDLTGLVEEINEALASLAAKPTEPEPERDDGPLVEGLNEALVEQHRQTAAIAEAVSTLASETKESFAGVRQNVEAVVDATKEAVATAAPAEGSSQLAEHIKAIQRVPMPAEPTGDGGLSEAFITIEDEFGRTRPPHVTGDGITVYNDGRQIALVADRGGPFGLDDADIIMPLTEAFSLYAHYSGERIGVGDPHYATVGEVYIGKFCHVRIRVEARQCDGMGATNNHPGENQARWLQNADGGDTEILNSLSVWNGGGIYAGDGGAADEWVSLAWTLIETDLTIDYSAGAAHKLKDITIQASFDQAAGYLTIRVKNERNGAYSFVLVATIEVVYHTVVSDPNSPPDHVELGNCACHDMYPTDDWNDFGWGAVPEE